MDDFRFNINPFFMGHMVCKFVCIKMDLFPFDMAWFYSLGGWNSYWLIETGLPIHSNACNEWFLWSQIKDYPTGYQILSICRGLRPNSTEIKLFRVKRQGNETSEMWIGHHPHSPSSMNSLVRDCCGRWALSRDRSRSSAVVSITAPLPIICMCILVRGMRAIVHVLHIRLWGPMSGSCN